MCMCVAYKCIYNNIHVIYVIYVIYVWNHCWTGISCN